MRRFEPEFASRVNNSKFAGWWNVTLCTCIVIGGVYMGVTQQPFGFLVAAGAAVVDVLFVRRLLAAYQR